LATTVYGEGVSTLRECSDPGTLAGEDEAWGKGAQGKRGRGKRESRLAASGHRKHAGEGEGLRRRTAGADITPSA
jgi:hypothetical protein